MKRYLSGILVFLFLLFFAKPGFSQHCNLALSYTLTGCGACVSAGAGVSPFLFSWNTGITASCVSGLTPGSYQVTVYDATGCWDTITVNISSLPPLHVTMTPFGNPSCPCYTIGILGGTGPYTYSWDGMTWAGSTPLCGLLPGSHQVQVTDAYGCSADTFFNVSTSALSFLTTITPALCRNGTATVTASGANRPFTYLWNTVPPQTDSFAVGLHANTTVTITVTDDSGCVQTQHIQIHTNSNLSSGINVVPDTCGHGVGSLTAYGLAGFPPYQYHWNTNDTVAVLTNQGAGNYSVTVTDDSGCVSVASNHLSDYSPVVVTATIVQPSCTSFTGSITLNTSGGSFPYNYFWSTVPVQTTNVASGLATGYYSCLVTDQQGCTANIAAWVTDSSSFHISASATNDVCGQGNGSVTVTTTNGVPPFSYQWKNLPPDTNSVLSNLHAGHVQCIVTDQAMCVRKATAYVQYYSPVQVSVTPHNATCIFNADGWATANVTGATPPLTFGWTGDTSSTKTNLLPGSYSCFVTDSIGCETYRTYHIGYDSIAPCAVTVEGTVFNDANTNCIPEAGDFPLWQMMVGCTPSGGFKSADAAGRYSFYLPPGNYRVWQPQLPPWHVAVCPALDYYDTLPVVGMRDTNNFANIGDAMDLSIQCFTSTVPRPGFAFAQSVYYRNQGTRVVSNAVLKIKHDSLITFLSSSLAGANYDAVNHVLTVNLPSLNPYGSYSGSQGQVQVNYLIPSNVPIGTILDFTDTIFPLAGDTVAFNNYEYCVAEVVGSFDPNDIQVNPKGTGLQGYITTADSLLTYLVRFQNTGNYPAQNVVIKMQLDADLDWSSFKAEGSSFPYSIDISPTGLATYSFLNIYLPDSTFDEPHSHGYFAFSCRQQAGLIPGTEITASADIYFDFNAPVLTNTVLNTLYLPSGIHEPGKGGMPVIAFPNPSTGKLSVQLEVKKPGNVTLEILDAMGKRMSHQNKIFSAGIHTSEFNLEAYPAGIYFIRVNSDDVNNVLKIAKF